MEPNRLLPFILVVGCVSFFTVGCSGAMLENAPRPSVELASVTITDLSLRAVEMEWKVKVSNPYWVAVPLTRVQYELFTHGESMLTGTVDSSEPVPAGGTSTVPVTIRLPFSQVLSRLKGVKSGEVIPYTGRVNLTVKAPVVGSMSLSTESRGEFPVPAVPRLQFNQLRWEQLTLSSAVARMDVELFNPNQFPLTLRTFSYNIRLAGEPVAGNKLKRSVSFDSNQSQTIPLEFEFSPVRFGTALFQTLLGSGSELALSGQLTVQTRFGALEIPFDQQGPVSFSSP